MFPELITRPDLKVLLPPIGSTTAYIFGDPKILLIPDVELTCRVHDECNGSDVFGSDIQTVVLILLYGIEQAAAAAQKGQVGLIVYFRKEGRALGEVTKFLGSTMHENGKSVVIRLKHIFKEQNVLPVFRTQGFKS